MVAAPTTPSSKLADSPIREVAVKRAHDVIEQAAHSTGENPLLALFRVISLDHPNAAQRFRQASCYFGIDLSAFTEDGTDSCERAVQGEGETSKRADGNQRQRGADAKQQRKRNSGRDQSSGKVHQARPQQIANAFYVAHDARHQSAGFIGIIKGHRQTRDVRLHLLAKVGNQALGGLRQQLGQRKGSDALNKRRE